MRYILAFLDFLLMIVLLPILLLVTLLTKPKPDDTKPRVAEYDYDKDAAVKHLSEAIRIPTVSVTKPEHTYQPFLDFHRFIHDSYPNITARAELTKIWDYSLVYRIPGKDSSLQPIAVLAHQDVVPAGVGWKDSEPFSGEVKDGFVYGRGTQDMKGTLLSILEAVEAMLAGGFVPDRDLYMCFGHDEEPFTTNGAKNIVKYFSEKGIKFASILDEGGAMLDGKLLGIDGTVCMVGTCEKGYLDATVTTRVDAGHASNPGRKTAVGLMSKTILKILKNPLPSKWTPVVDETFRELAPHMNFLFRFLFANRVILKPLLMVALGFIPITNAMISTTIAPTMLKGSDASNVLPGECTANINCRLLPIHSLKQVVGHMDKLAKSVDPRASVELMMGNEPSPYCSCDSEPFRILSHTIRESFENCVSAPFMFVAGTDARYYYPVCDQIYRFTPFMFSMEDTKRVHGKDERCSIADYHRAINFFMLYLENATK